MHSLTFIFPLSKINLFLTKLHYNTCIKKVRRNFNMTSISNGWMNVLGWCPQNTTIPTDIYIDDIQKGNLSNIKKSVEANPEFLKTSLSNGELPLHFAIQNKQIEVLEYFLSKGADPLQKDHRGMTALDHAVVKKDEKAAALIIANLVHKDITDITELFKDPTTKQYLDSSIAAAKSETGFFTEQDTESLRLLLIGKGKTQQETFSINPEARDTEGNTLTHFAVKSGNIAWLKLFLEKGCPVDAPNKQGWTPLHLAAAINHLPMFQMLIEKGADLYRKDLNGISPLTVLGGSAAYKDPLRLEYGQILMFASAAFYWTTYSLLGNDPRAQAVLGAFSAASLIGEFVDICTKITSPQKDIPFKVAVMFSAGALSSLGWLNNHFSIGYLPLRAWMTYRTANISFNGIARAWKERSYDPLKALRNVVVHTGNTMHSLYSLHQVFNRAYCSFNQWRNKADCDKATEDYAKHEQNYKQKEQEIITKYNELKKNKLIVSNRTWAEKETQQIEDVINSLECAYANEASQAVLTYKEAWREYVHIFLEKCYCSSNRLSDLW